LHLAQASPASPASLSQKSTYDLHQSACLSCELGCSPHFSSLTLQDESFSGGCSGYVVGSPQFVVRRDVVFLQAPHRYPRHHQSIAHGETSTQTWKGLSFAGATPSDCSRHVLRLRPFSQGRRSLKARKRIADGVSRICPNEHGVKKRNAHCPSAAMPLKDSKSFPTDNSNLRIAGAYPYRQTISCSPLRFPVPKLAPPLPTVCLCSIQRLTKTVLLCMLCPD